MDLHEKTPILREQRKMRSLFAAVCLGVFLLCVLHSAMACSRYVRAQDQAVTVCATITNVTKDSDPEEGRVYDVFIEYEYDGSSYTFKYRDDTRYSVWARRIGDTIQVQIDPDHPQEPLEAMRDDMRRFLLGLFFLGGGLVILNQPDHRYWTAAYGVSTETAKKDLEWNIRRRWIWKWCVISSAVMLSFKLLFFPVLSIWLLPAGAVLALLGIVGFLRCRRDLNKVEMGAFTICDLTVVGKPMDETRNDKRYHYLTFTDGTEKWKIRVKENEYNSIASGEMRKAAFLEGESKPEMIFLSAVPEIV